jgi:negative regulator of sigma E activity
VVEPSWPTTPPDWQTREGSAATVKLQDTGWSVARVPPGFAKIMEGYRKRRGKQDPVAHLVYSDGLSRSACSSSRCRRRRRAPA